jgi:hypothetical protein
LPSFHAIRELLERRGAVARHIRVRGVPRREPDVRLYVLALIELARQLQAEEEAAGAQPADDSQDRPATPAGKLGAGS